MTTAGHGALGWVSVCHLQHIIARGEAAGLKVDEWRHASEYVLGAIVVVLRLLLPERKDLFRSVGFAHAGPDNAELQREHAAFVRCLVYFNQWFLRWFRPLTQQTPAQFRASQQQ